MNRELRAKTREATAIHPLQRQNRRYDLRWIVLSPCDHQLPLLALRTPQVGIDAVVETTSLIHHHRFSNLEHLVGPFNITRHADPYGGLHPVVNAEEDEVGRLVYEIGDEDRALCHVGTRQSMAGLPRCQPETVRNS